MGETTDLCFNYAKLGFKVGFLFALAKSKTIKKFDKVLKENNDDFLFRVKEDAIKEIKEKIE